MPRVSNRIFLLEQWSRGIAEVTAVQGTNGFVPTLLASVRRLVDFDFVMVFAYRGDATPLMLGDTLDDVRHRIIVRDYVAGPFLLDPFFQLVSKGKRSGCYRLQAIAPDHFRRSEYFRVHYGRTNIAEEIGVVFDLGEDLTGVASFARWDSSPPVGRGERDILAAIEPAIGTLCARHWSNVHGVEERDPAGGHAAGRDGFRMLSGREREIVSMILQGHSTESIALHLDISPGTVKIHRKNIYRKMAISTQAELFAAFMGFTPASALGPAYSLRGMDKTAKIAQFRSEITITGG